MNINKYHNDLLAAVGDSTGAGDVNEFRKKFVDAMAGIGSAGDLTALGGTITGATANDTMTAVADAVAASTDTSAASLASVNTAIAAIENNFADLQAKVNAIIAALAV